MDSQSSNEDTGCKFFLFPRHLNDMNINDKQLSIIKLPHPRVGNPSLFLFNHAKKQMFEITQFTDQYRSWFIEDTVKKDGGLYFATPVDPLFLIMKNVKQAKNFCLLRDIIADEEFPDYRYLMECLTPNDVKCIAEHKVIEEGHVFRYSGEKALCWLKLKVKQVAKLLQIKNISSSTGSKAATLIQKRTRDSLNEDCYFPYACQLVAEYLEEGTANALFNSFSLQNNGTTSMKNLENLSDEPSPKKAKIEEPVKPLEDYSKMVNWNTSKIKSSKLTSAQKQLQKVDKTGMKNISSFFGKKR